MTGTDDGQTVGGTPSARPSAPAKAKATTPIDVVSRSLRQAYDETLQESIPDAFMDLLRKLD